MPASAAASRENSPFIDHVPDAEPYGAGAKKKSLHATERDTPRVKKLRRAWCRAAAQIDPCKLVFVDESGVNTAMTRTRGRAPKGQRVHGAVPNGDWKTVTMLGAIRADGIAAAATAP